METDSPYLSPQPVRGKPNEPANVLETARFVAELRGVGARRARRHRARELRQGLRLVRARKAPAETGLPRQASLNRLRRFDVRPNRELGQNFLVDDNVLGVIGREAELGPADVVLEVGGGLGVLSEHLAPRVGHLHVVEVDRGLEPPLREALAGLPNSQLHLADAVTLDLGGAATRARQGGGQPALRSGGHRAPAHRGGAAGVTLWVAMVQREVAERLAAEPGSKTFGATSVLAQLACEVTVLRRVSRTVFHPVPNVDSALLRMRRAGPAAPAPVAALVHAAFAHRRKALAGSLALAAEAPRGHPRPRPRGAGRARAPRRRARRAPGAAGLHARWRR